MSYFLLLTRSIGLNSDRFDASARNPNFMILMIFVDFVLVLRECESNIAFDV